MRVEEKQRTRRMMYKHTKAYVSAWKQGKDFTKCVNVIMVNNTANFRQTTSFILTKVCLLKFNYDEKQNPK